VTTYVGKPSAVGQPTKPTQPFILLGQKMSSKLQLDVVTTAVAALSGECEQRLKAGMVLFAG